jgi:transcriptional regulator with XRE-family HTH domain
MTPKYESFGQRIQRLLSESGRSQAWLAHHAKLSSSVVSRLIRGDRLPMFEHVAAMAATLGLTVDALVAGTEAAQRIAVASQYVTREQYEAVHRQVVEQVGEIAELESQLSAARSEHSQASAQHRTAHQALSDKLEQTARELSQANRELAAAKLALRRHQAALHHAATDVAVLHGKLAAVRVARTDPSRLAAALAGLDAIGCASAAEYLDRALRGHDDP